MTKNFNGPMFYAVKELNAWMKENNLPKIEINAIGGFALMVHGVRGEKEITDIDYVGPTITKMIEEKADEIGNKYRLPNKWLNNDVMLTGSSVEDFEFATGALSFEDAINYDKIKINVLCEKDLLRLKLISIDTALTAVELGGDFTREKDLPDIKNLSERLGFNKETLKKEYSCYLINGDTLKAVQSYIDSGIIEFRRYLKKATLKNALKNIAPKENYETSDYIRTMLGDLFSR